jgi:S-formylglutathione hydrolase
MFGGFVKRYAHQSSQLGCKMNFSLFVPPAAADGGKVPVGRDMLVTGADAGP